MKDWILSLHVPSPVRASSHAAGRMPVRRVPSAPRRAKRRSVSLPAMTLEDGRNSIETPSRSICCGGTTAALMLSAAVTTRRNLFNTQNPPQSAVQHERLLGAEQVVAQDA